MENLQMVACNNCKKNFFIHAKDHAKCCAFCGSKTKIYYTYSYNAEPTYEELD